MQRDSELIEKILFAVERHSPDAGFMNLQIPGYTDAQISYHVGLLVESGHLEAYNFSGDDKNDWRPTRLTDRGHTRIAEMRRRQEAK